MEHKKLHVLIAVLAAVVVGLISIGAIAYQKMSYDHQVTDLKATVSTLQSAKTSSPKSEETKDVLTVSDGTLEVSHCDSFWHYVGTGDARKAGGNVSSTGNIGSDDVKIKCYQSFTVSPDKKFVLLSAAYYEAGALELYRVSDQKVYPFKLSTQSSDNFNPGTAEWNEDNTLTVKGSTGLGLDRNIYESVSAEKPWELKIIGQQPVDEE